MEDKNVKLTNKQKNSHEKKWYKEELDALDSTSFDNNSAFTFTDGRSEYHNKMKLYYDLYNNTIRKEDFEFICAPFGTEVGELPNGFTNKDIISGKIKAVQGMEMKRAFPMRVFAVNEDATTRREQEEFGRMQQYTINQILYPIRQMIQQQKMQELEQSGQEITPEIQQQMQQEVEQELQSQTPKEVKNYMAREHQDPAERLAVQILAYLQQEQDLQRKFNAGWKHALISGNDVYWVGSVGNRPMVRVVNPMYFDFDRNSESDFVQDGEWAAYEMWLSPSEVVSMFPELTDAEVRKIYKRQKARLQGYADESMMEPLQGREYLGNSVYSSIRVLHGEWKALRPIFYLEYYDQETGQVLETVVDEDYKLVPEIGDIRLTKDWIVSKYEGYKIDTDIYAGMREVPRQYKDLRNPRKCQLSFIGAVYDATNSEPTSLLSRMKDYQYLYNIISYKAETLMLSDKGKALLLNTQLIPKDNGLSPTEWLHFFEVNKIGLMSPSEEGHKYGFDVTNAAKEIDLSLASDINNYMLFCQYVEERCGQAVGITKQIEGQIGNYETASNAQQAIVQSANILEPYFDLHNIVKRDVTQALLETAKICYTIEPPESLSYILDDLSVELLSIDSELLENSEYGLFVSNTSRADEILQTVQQLAHAALQNQKIELSDVIKVFRSDSLQEAEEFLLVAEQINQERQQALQQQQNQAMAEEAEKARAWEKEKIAMEHSNKMEEIEAKGEIDLQKQAMLSMGFNEDKDLDKDGVPDILEVLKYGRDAEVKSRELDLKDKDLELKDRQHKEKMEVEKSKVSMMKAKNVSSK